MGRECRRVPATWQHPINEKGQLVPLYDESFEEASSQWKKGYADYQNKPEPRVEGGFYEFWEWDVGPPERDSYRPHWKEEERTHFQMYETVSEGTPLSPVFDTPEKVARWCADHPDECWGKSSYKSWLAVAKGGWAPSFVMIGGKFMCGVDFAGENENKNK